MASATGNMGRRGGFTLIEMLIAMVILSMVMTLASTMYSTYIKGFNSEQRLITQSLQSLKSQQRLQQQISAAIYYYIKTPNLITELLFKGQNQQLFWISGKSMSKPDSPAAAWLGIDNGQLVYCERLLTDYLVTGAELLQSTLCEHFRFEIQPAESVSFSYFGFESRADRFPGSTEFSNELESKPAQWYPQYEGAQHGLLPDYIRYDVTNEDKTDQYWITILSHDINKMREFDVQSHG